MVQACRLGQFLGQKPEARSFAFPKAALKNYTKSKS
jgi:hypothetical protein